jgi:hypothetical protein
VAKAYSGALAALQVECRLVDQDDRRSQSFSPFRSWDFDACVFIVLDCNTEDAIRAVEGSRGVTELIRQALDDVGD